VDKIKDVDATYIGTMSDEAFDIAERFLSKLETDIIEFLEENTDGISS
jgi:hypothetical protein